MPNRIIAEGGTSKELAALTESWVRVLAEAGELCFITGQIEPVQLVRSPEDEAFILKSPESGLILSPNGNCLVELLDRFDFHFEWLAISGLRQRENYPAKQLGWPYADGNPKPLKDEPEFSIEESVIELFVCESAAILLSTQRHVAELCASLADPSIYDLKVDWDQSRA